MKVTSQSFGSAIPQEFTDEVNRNPFAENGFKFKGDLELQEVTTGSFRRVSFLGENGEETGFAWNGDFTAVGIDGKKVFLFLPVRQLMELGCVSVFKDGGIRWKSSLLGCKAGNWFSGSSRAIARKEKKGSKKPVNELV